LTVPTIMGLEYSPGDTLQEKWERLAGSGDCVAIAIASADDEGRLTGSPAMLPRARQNVWVEVGYFWGKSRGRRGLLLMPQRSGAVTLDLPSDLVGLEVFEWNSSPLEQKETIRRFLESFLPSPRSGSMPTSV